MGAGKRMTDFSEALRESEERYRTLFEQAPIGVFLYDRDLRVVTCNARFAHILKSSLDKIIGFDLSTLRDRSVVPAIIKALEGDVASHEGRYQATVSDAEVWISMRLAPRKDARGAVIGGLGVVEDCTERVKALEVLRATGQRLSLYVQRNSSRGTARSRSSSGTPRPAVSSAGPRPRRSGERSLGSPCPSARGRRSNRTGPSSSRGWTAIATAA
jgi:PAS domain S-box-containing protein